MYFLPGLLLQKSVMRLLSVSIHDTVTLTTSEVSHDVLPRALATCHWLVLIIKTATEGNTCMVPAIMVL